MTVIYCSSSVYSNKEPDIKLKWTTLLLVVFPRGVIVGKDRVSNIANSSSAVKKAEKDAMAGMAK